MQYSESTILALSTPPGVGAIGIIRLSGPQAVDIADTVFKGKKLAEQASHTLHFGRIMEPETQQVAGAMPEIIDEVVVGLYRAPHSYTGEDVVEISCHGSQYILRRVMEVCIEAGATPAQPGEFTRRAFLHGKMDLTQAEAVGDLIAAESKAAQRSAMHHLRGGFSAALKAMREELITFSALIELELDFSQEDVEFADRHELYALLERIEVSAKRLIDSFRLGNVVKNGVSVAIIGAPNAGKSTLLNALLNEERAIVSEIAGTTRDTIEEVMNIDGILFRFIDTAGIRNHTDDLIEQQGIARSRKKADEADIVIELIEAAQANLKLKQGEMLTDYGAEQLARTIPVVNKIDELNASTRQELASAFPDALAISAKDVVGIEALKERLKTLIAASDVQPGDTLITSSRHMSALLKIAAAVTDIKSGLNDDIPGDLIALDIRQALHYIGELTGQVYTDRDVLGAIFGKFCIGK